MFPQAASISAVPRWSHRDPVEGGNPFPPGSCHEAWSKATKQALADLLALDAQLQLSAQVTLDPILYRTQMLDLAVKRFDTWVNRGCAVIRDKADLNEFKKWLTLYVDNWLVYAEDTCPYIDMRDELEYRLRAKSQDWCSRGLLATQRIPVTGSGDSHIMKR